MRKGLGAAAALAMALAACGGSGRSADDDDRAAGGAGETARAAAASGGTAPSSDPCALFTQAEVGSIIGTPVTRQEAPTARRCVYYTADPVVYVDLEVDRADADASWTGVNAGNAAIGAAQDSLAGIGDEAFFGPRDKLYARKGGTFVAVEAGFDDKVRDRARKVARAALDRAG
jgi:hypothetical protein